MTELGPRDVAERLAQKFAEALESTHLLDVVEIRAQTNHVNILARVSKGKEKQMIHGPAKAMLLATLGKRIEIFIGKTFFVKKNRKLMYAWAFTVASDDLAGAINLLCDVLEDSDDAGGIDVMEAPLMGRGTPLGSLAVTGSGSKGAAPVW